MWSTVWLLMPWWPDDRVTSVAASEASGSHIKCEIYVTGHDAFNRNSWLEILNKCEGLKNATKAGTVIRENNESCVRVKLTQKQLSFVVMNWYSVFMKLFSFSYGTIVYTILLLVSIGEVILRPFIHTKLYISSRIYTQTHKMWWIQLSVRGSKSRVGRCQWLVQINHNESSQWMLIRVPPVSLSELQQRACRHHGSTNLCYALQRLISERAMKSDDRRDDEFGRLFPSRCAVERSISSHMFNVDFSIHR